MMMKSSKYELMHGAVTSMGRALVHVTSTRPEVWFVSSTSHLEPSLKLLD